MHRAPLSLGFLLLLAGCASTPAVPAPRAEQRPEAPEAPEVIEVAITVDDLPRHGPELPGHEPLAITQTLLAAFQRHGVPRVYGFVNGAKAEESPAERAVLEAWVAAGHPLGNHQWTHADLHKVSPAEFVDGVRRNEALLQALQPQVSEAVWKTFRYPYLHEGNTLPDRDAVRAHLAGSGYRVAQVTIDPYDWAYNDAYARCVAKGSTEVAAALRKQFLSEARAKLRWAVAMSRGLLGRPMRHVLLLHLGMVDAATVEELLSDYERLGVRWVPLERVMEDPVYAENPNQTFGGMFLFQLARARGITPPPPPLTPTALIDTLCR
jgi:peptidoglycan/xylan/chitin deacetylase (PgdA/CDA1 family)